MAQAVLGKGHRTGGFHDGNLRLPTLDAGSPRSARQPGHVPCGALSPDAPSRCVLTGGDGARSLPPLMPACGPHPPDLINLIMAQGPRLETLSHGVGAWGGGSGILQTQSMHHAQNKREGPSLRKKLRSKGAWAADRMSVWTDGIRANREMFKGIWRGW